MCVSRDDGPETAASAEGGPRPHALGPPPAPAEYRPSGPLAGPGLLARSAAGPGGQMHAPDLPCLRARAAAGDAREPQAFAGGRILEGARLGGIFFAAGDF